MHLKLNIFKSQLSLSPIQHYPPPPSSHPTPHLHPHPNQSIFSVPCLGAKATSASQLDKPTSWIHPWHHPFLFFPNLIHLKGLSTFPLKYLAHSSTYLYFCINPHPSYHNHKSLLTCLLASIMQVS